MNETVTLWAWIGVSLVGIGYTLWNLVDARRDREAILAAGKNGVLRLVTGSNVRRETVRLVFWCIAFSVGLLVLIELDGPYLGWALVLVMALNAYNSREDRRERRAVRRLNPKVPGEDAPAG